MYNKMIKWLKIQTSLQKKIVSLYIVMALIPIILITLTANVIYTGSFLRQSYEFVDRNAEQYKIIVEERLEQYTDVLYDLITDREYIDLAATINTGTLSSWLVDREMMENKFRSIIYTHAGIRGMVFLADNGYYASSSRYYGSTGDIIWSDEEERTKLYHQVAEQDALTIMAMVDLNKRGSVPDYAVLLGYPVKDLKTKEKSGVQIIALDADVLQFAGVSSAQYGIITVITDQDEQILIGVEDTYVNVPFAQYIKSEFGKSRIAVREMQVGQASWKIKSIINIARQRRDIVRFDLMVFLLTVIIVLVFFFLVYHISKGYLENINRIVNAIAGFGETPEVIDVELENQDELYVIAKQFNVMTRRVNDLMKTLKQRNEEIKIAAQNQKHAEIAALEAQINPHFLYNTLDSINWRAIAHGEEEISDMLGNLGSLLRYSVSNIDQVVMLAAEIEWLKKYVFLQRDRFNNSFDCVYDVTEEASEFPIYKMLLQPIIENTVLHAFEQVRENGLIEVRAYVKDKKLRIHIKDNGCGMNEEKLAEIREKIQGSGALSSESIGISNIIHRLKIYYQDEASIWVESSEQGGTEFILTIPKQE